MVRAITNDPAYAARALRKTPGFALAAVGLLAVGIGGTTVVFSPADALLFLAPLLGPGDEWAAQGELPAVPSNEFWHTRFQSSPGALGSVLRLNGQALVVVACCPCSAVIACVGLADGGGATRLARFTHRPLANLARRLSLR